MSIAYDYAYCPAYSVFFGGLGVFTGIVLSCAGSAIGTAKCGIGLCSAALISRGTIVRALIAPIMSGVIGIYGLVFSIVAYSDFSSGNPYHIQNAMSVFGGGLCVGFSGLAAGVSIGISGQYGIVCYAKQPDLFVGLTLVLIFGEVLGIYGMVISLVLKKSESCYSFPTTTTE